MGDLRAVVPKNHLLLPSVQESIQQLDAADSAKDAGLRRLAEVYAGAIDDAIDISLHAQELVAKAQDPDDDFDVPKRLLNALVKYSDANNVLEQLGPKLQAVLESLGASPKARHQMTGKGGPPNVPAGGQTPFERRRAAAAAREQAARANGSPPVDSTA